MKKLLTLAMILAVFCLASPAQAGVFVNASVGVASPVPAYGGCPNYVPDFDPGLAYPSYGYAAPGYGYGGYGYNSTFYSSGYGYPAYRGFYGGYYGGFQRSAFFLGNSNNVVIAGRRGVVAVNGGFGGNNVFVGRGFGGGVGGFNNNVVVAGRRGAVVAQNNGFGNNVVVQQRGGLLGRRSTTVVAQSGAGGNNVVVAGGRGRRR